MLHPLMADSYQTTTGTDSASNVRKIQGLINDGAHDPLVRAYALRILNDGGVEARDELGELGALLAWVQRFYPYRKDIHGTETLASARALLRMHEAGTAGADCDDYTILLGAFAKSIGYPVRIVTTKSPRMPEFWTHIYLEALTRRGGWLPMDATNATAPLGWESPAFTAKRRYSPDGPGYQDEVQRVAVTRIPEPEGEPMGGGLGQIFDEVNESADRISGLVNQVLSSSSISQGAGVPATLPPRTALAVAAGFLFYLALRRP